MILESNKKDGFYGSPQKVRIGEKEILDLDEMHEIKEIHMKEVKGIGPWENSFKATCPECKMPNRFNIERDALDICNHFIGTRKNKAAFREGKVPRPKIRKGFKGVKFTLNPP